MSCGPLRVLLLAASALVACEGREVSVFDLPTKLGEAGTPGMAGSTSGGGGATSDTAQAGSSNGGSSVDGGAFETSGGWRGMGFPGAGGSAPATCGSDADCAGWLCEKQGCDAQTGVCVPWPPLCPPNPAPVCGCDGVTYWNDCIRLQAQGHPQQQSMDQCRANAATCEVGADCMAPYASCSHLLPPGQMCGHGMGACWVLPPQCESNADNRMWRECKPPDPGQAPACLDTCNAIASEHTYGELHRGDVCN